MPCDGPIIPIFDAAAAGGPVAVKICGFTDGPNIEAVAGLGADAVGLNFWPGSKRHVAARVAASWVPGLPASVLRVGVFVNAGFGEIAGLFEDGVIHAAQLHGDEDPSLAVSLRAAGVPVIRAFAFSGAGDLERAMEHGTPYVLADAAAPGQYGGTGRILDHAALARAALRHPAIRLGVAGGLRPENVGAVVAAVRPCLVDVAGGVESEPGIKDLALVAAFIEAARAGGIRQPV